MEHLLEDLRFAARMLRKAPGYTAVAILTLALAIGANTAIFSVVNGALLRPLPFPHPEQLVVLERHDADGMSETHSVAQYVSVAAQAEVFSQVAAYQAMGSGFNLVGDGVPERVTGYRVTGGFFDTFAVRPALGRGFLKEEDVPHGARVAVLGHALWQRRFGGDPGIVGRSVVLNDEPYTVVGVAPASFRYPADAELWTPLQLDLTVEENANFLFVLGRSAPGVGAARLASALKLASDRLHLERPHVLEKEDVWRAEPLQAYLTGPVRPALWVLLGAVAGVLLIACVNLANLQLARAGVRGRELVVRAALGASPGRLVRQMLTESLLLSVVGGALGVLLAQWLLPALLALAPDSLPLPEGVGVDGGVLLFAAAASLLTGLLFGLLPALQSSRPQLQGALKEGALRATSGRAGVRTRTLLVVGEVALSVVLLVGALLLVRSFVALRSAPLGVRTERVLSMKLALPEARYGTPQALEDFERRVLERVRALPGVEAAAFTATLPTEIGSSMEFVIAGREGEEPAGGQFRPVTPEYFATLGLPLARGRLLAETDRAGAEPVVVINEAAARRYWPGQDPLGQRLTVAASVPSLRDVVPRTVVGVVKDVRERGLAEEPPPVLYVTPGQMSPGIAAVLVRFLPQALVVRGAGEPAALATAIQREVWGVDGRQPVTHVLPLEQVVARSVGSERFTMLLLGALAALALVLSAVGVYGVLSFLVGQRTREMGVRLALGATRGGVVLLVLRQSLGAVGLGVAVGTAGALALSRLMSGLLHQVSALDPVSFLAAPLVLLGVALVASWLPARRAARVEPTVALRAE